MILGLDVSHFQQGANFAAAKAAGRDFVVLKATEGTTYADPSFAAFRQQAHAAGMVVGCYHFCRAGNVAAEAAWFVKTVGTLQPGEFLVLDQEVPNTVAWCKAWLDAVKAATGVAPLIYMNKGAATGVGMGDWSTVAKTYGLWIASYDNAPAAQNAVPYWGVPAMKQYSDAGSVLGVSGGVDVDSFFGTRDQLLAYGKGGSDMPLTPDDLNAVALAVWGFKTSGQGTQAQDRLTGEDLMLQALTKAVAALPASQAPQIDEAKLAAALLADPASVDALGKAIAAHLKLSSG